MFKKVLVANRGEIAIRVIRACRELGLKTVAVYSDADRNALHVMYADEAVHIGPAPAVESYLKIPKIIEAANSAGADAVHPGYGFLAENAHFASICQTWGLTFIGPSATAIHEMGLKAVARARMIAAGVPVVPGSEETIGSEKQALELAADIGYPVMIKASAGGGGIGIRIALKEDELITGFQRARREAEAAFGSGELYLEKYLEQPRHIEVQVLGDAKGSIIHLGERDCSLQRRRQKLLEESPSPVVTPELRERITRAAVMAAAAVDYTNAGTVEFLLDQDGSFYFLEMNTRIQVEHPVTEVVTGVDLVQEQIRIAAGDDLRYRQEDIVFRGHAIECRINAEDPARGFLPSPGLITEYRVPGGPGVRVDDGVYAGFEVPTHYDSLIGKLIVTGPRRQEAVSRMRRALRDYHVGGIRTTIPIHLQLLDNPAFLDNRVDTNFLERFAAETARAGVM
ncbi:MAG: acetyl-CoA carboxylase biotin carboxylase subunit [Firmicutes bacterium]|nr:acetyl-CoA carboxylase biotin carboxylase subunit [Bacillota bacterium]